MEGMEASCEEEMWSEVKKCGGGDKNKERGVEKGMKGGKEGGIRGGRQGVESGEENRRKRRGGYVDFIEMEEG